MLSPSLSKFNAMKIPQSPQYHNCVCVCVYWLVTQISGHLNSLLQSLDSSGRTPSVAALNCWTCARPIVTEALHHLPASALRPLPAAPTTPPASPETLTTADAEKSQRYHQWGPGLGCTSTQLMLVILPPAAYWVAVWKCFREAAGNDWDKQRVILLGFTCLLWGKFVNTSVMKWRRSLIEAQWLCVFAHLQMVLKINGIFEARRGKKRMKRVSQSTEASSGRGVCEWVSTPLCPLRHGVHLHLAGRLESDIWPTATTPPPLPTCVHLALWACSHFLGQLVWAHFFFQDVEGYAT